VGLDIWGKESRMYWPNSGIIGATASGASQSSNRTTP
jgi:hypothetical protein